MRRHHHQQTDLYSSLLPPFNHWGLTFFYIKIKTKKKNPTHPKTSLSPPQKKSELTELSEILKDFNLEEGNQKELNTAEKLPLIMVLSNLQHLQLLCLGCFGCFFFSIYTHLLLYLGSNIKPPPNTSLALKQRYTANTATVTKYPALSFVEL